QLAIAENLDRSVAIDDARLFQHFGSNFGIAERRQPVEVHDVVFLAENVGKSALRNTPVQRHLPAFKSADEPRARARPLALVTARGSLAHAGAHAAADTLLLFRCLLRCPYC